MTVIQCRPMAIVPPFEAGGNRLESSSTPSSSRRRPTGAKIGRQSVSPSPTRLRGRRWREAPDEHLCLESSLFWGIGLPGSTFCDESIGEDDELACDGDESGFGAFSVGDKPVVEGFHTGVVGFGGEGGEIENSAHCGSSA